MGNHHDQATRRHRRHAHRAVSVIGVRWRDLSRGGLITRPSRGNRGKWLGHEADREPRAGNREVLHRKKCGECSRVRVLWVASTTGQHRCIERSSGGGVCAIPCVAGLYLHASRCPSSFHGDDTKAELSLSWDHGTSRQVCACDGTSRDQCVRRGVHGAVPWRTRIWFSR